MGQIRYGAKTEQRSREIEATAAEIWSTAVTAVYETDPDIIAAVLPPLTQACALPPATSSKAFHILLSLPRLSTAAGFASIGRTELAACTPRRSLTAGLMPSNCASISRCLPTRMISRRESASSAATAAGIVTARPWSPPCTSRARTVKRLLFVELNNGRVDNLAALVVALRAYVMTDMCFTRGWLNRKRRRFQRVM